MDFISLFSGIGGFDLGLERAGMTCVAQVEIDNAASDVLARHYPTVWRFEDVKHVGKQSLPPVQLVCGGSPCQDVSVAGRGAGLAGERSGLFFEYLRVLAELRPEWFIFENVPGLLSSNKGRDFGIVLHSLAECGYGVAYRVLDAQYFGVPQRRRRVFIVGHLGDGRAAQVLFERESSAGNSTPSGKTKKELARDVAATLRSRSERSGGKLDNETGLTIVGTLSASGAGTARPAGQKNELDFLIPFNKQRSDQYSSASVDPTLAARDYKDNGDLVLAFSPQASMAGHGSSIVRIGNKTGALQVSKREGVLNMQGVRRLTPTECERLQGFPDNWTYYGADDREQSDAQRYKQLGNAVAVPVIEWIGKRIMAVTS